MSELRVGLGVDAHAFGDDVPLVLGGVAIDDHRGLAGHSDGDVIAHALTDALLGAASAGAAPPQSGERSAISHASTILSSATCTRTIWSRRNGRPVGASPPIVFANVPVTTARATTASPAATTSCTS